LRAGTAAIRARSAEPVIVVEVISPSSEKIDTSVKLPDYFRVPSVMHYLIADPERPLIIHHARRSNDRLLTAIARHGPIALDPPGLELALRRGVARAEG
jgi:Uma2 family endonuclease